MLIFCASPPMITLDMMDESELPATVANLSPEESFNYAWVSTLLEEVLENATYVTAIEVVAKIIFYYLHERMWTNITWGKFMERQYWKERAWRKLYRDKHKQPD